MQIHYSIWGEERHFRKNNAYISWEEEHQETEAYIEGKNGKRKQIPIQISMKKCIVMWREERQCEMKQNPIR